MKKITLAIFLFLVGAGILPVTLFAQNTRAWSPAKAEKWYKKQGWLVGCNFIPSTAINQLEMWQAETFDSTTIDRELGWAAGLGMNVVRVYLHNLAWEIDPAGFKGRINTYLQIADRHGIRTVFVLFDDCWNDNPHPGKQPEPKPGVHNSGWVQGPGKERLFNPATWGPLEAYAKDILTAYSHDERVLMWDVYNEPGNSTYEIKSMPFLRKVFEWAWAVRPSQPLTCATWDPNFKELNAFQLASSDVITFHNYKDTTNLETEIKMLQERGRPIICTEYMARTNDSFFKTHLPIFKKHNVGAINWGLVSGKSNTIYPWGSPEGAPEPKLWFHDIFRADGTPYDPEEVKVIKELTAVKK